MKKTSLIIILSLIINFTSCQMIGKNDPSAAKDPKKIIIASYKGGKISLQDAEDELQKISRQNSNLDNITFEQLNFDQKKSIIQEIILRKLSYKIAKKRKLHKEEDYKKSVKDFKINLLQQKLLLDLYKDIQKEENLQKEYNKLVTDLEGKKDYKIRYIALKTQKEADNLYKKLKRRPKNFIREAKRKSIDKESAKNGGDIGYVLENNLPIAIAKNIKELKKGKISKPMNIGDKWLIVKLEDIRNAKINSFADSKKSLSLALSNKAKKEFVSKILKEAEIDIYQ